MIKRSILALAVLTATSVWGQQKDFKVEVSFRDAPAGAKYVLRSTDSEPAFADTVTLKKAGEKAVFKQAFTAPGHLSLSYIAPQGSPAVPAACGLFIEAPATIKVSGEQVETLPAAAIQGGVEDDPILRRIQPKNAAMYDAFLQYRAATQTPDNKPAVDSLIGVLNGLSEEISAIKREYIAARPQSVYSAALLAGMLREDPEVIEPLFAGLSQTVKDSKYGKTVADKLALIQAIQPGRPAPDFALKDIEGNTIRLSDFRGRWVLLDFWGSWCVWCRRGNPALVELYEKYGGKDFEIIGLAARDKDENWKKAIADDRLAWRHANLAHTEGGNELPARYNVSGFPTKILIDPQGNIAVVSVGYHQTDDPAAVKLIDALGETYVK